MIEQQKNSQEQTYLCENSDVADFPLHGIRELILQ